MKSIFFIITTCLLLVGVTAVSAQENDKNLNKNEILTILEDSPENNELVLITEENPISWFTRTEIFKAFDAILENKAYREDTEIRSRLITLSETHSFTDIRASAQLVLSEFGGDKIPSMFHYSQPQSGFNGLTAKQLNASMTYCAPPLTAKRPDFEIEAENITEALRASGRQEGRPKYRFDVPLRYGTISGGYYSIQGVGLTYKQNATPHKTVSLSSTNNRYIMKSDTEGTYWLIDGPHHMIGGASISKLIETRNGVERYLYRALPSSVSQIFELEDGQLFINFVNLNPSKRGGSHDGDVFIPSPLENYNPPIILYPDGRVSLGCVPDASKF